MTAVCNPRSTPLVDLHPPSLPHIIPCALNHIIPPLDILLGHSPNPMERPHADSTLTDHAGLADGTAAATEVSSPGPRLSIPFSVLPSNNSDRDP